MKNWQVYAIKYATREAKSRENFYGPSDPHEDNSMPLDYYIWVAVNGKNVVVVDTGFNETVANQRGRTFFRCPVSVLPQIGIDPADVSYVVVSHMHYDHIGNSEKFPHAKFVVQESEMSFWTGKYASKYGFNHLVEVDDVVYLVKENFKGMVHFVNGSEEILPGITVTKTGGHSAGLQVVTVETEKGKVVLAADATHFYRNIQEDRPFSVVGNLAEMYDSFEIVRKLTIPELIIPGHDPLVMANFPPATAELEGIVVRIA